MADPALPQPSPQTQALPVEPVLPLPAPQLTPQPPPSAPGKSGGRYGPFARWLLGSLFSPVEFPTTALGPLHDLSARGTPVYVLRSSSLLHLLYFNFAFWRLGLPLARASTGLGYRIFSPFARWYLGGQQATPPRDFQGDRAVATVAEAVRQGQAALVFLRRPRTISATVSDL